MTAWTGSLFTSIATESAEFQSGMIRLTAVIGGRVEDVTNAFVGWVSHTTFPWRVALDYCLNRAREGKSLPFTVQT